MKRKVLYAISLCAILMLFVVGCKKNELYKYSGIIQGIVYDGNTNAPIDGVSVDVVVNGVAVNAISSATGYSVSDLPSGDYYLTFSKTGYASRIVYQNIPTYTGTSTVMTSSSDDKNVIKITKTVNPILYTLDGVVTGTVYKSVNGKEFPAVGIAVQVTYPDVDVNVGLTPNSYSAQTDADGKFLLDSLPSTSAILSVLAHNDGTTDFGSFTNTIKLVPRVSIAAGNIVVRKANVGNLQVVDGNVLTLNAGAEKLDINGNIIVTFNKNLANKVIKLYSNTENRYVQVALTGKALTTVTVDPQETLNVSSVYNIEIYATASDGDILNTNYEIQTQDGINYVSSNLEIADGQFTTNFDVNLNITFTFNMPVNPAITKAQGFIELKNSFHSVVLTDITFADNQITIDPTEALKEASNYTISMKVFSSYANDFCTIDIGFITFSSIVSAPGEVTNFALSGYDNTYTFDHNSTLFNVEFDKTNNAQGYEIWAKDSHHNSNWIKVQTLYSDNNATQYLFGTIDLSLFSEFDFYSNDGIQTPLSHETIVSFKIRAINTVGSGPFSSVITVFDETAPLIDNQFIITNYNNPSADNSTGTDPVLYKIKVSSIQQGFYFKTIENPQFSMQDNDPSGTPDSLTYNDITYNWSNESEGEFIITIPAGSNYSFDQINIIFLDASKNKSQVYTVTLY